MDCKENCGQDGSAACCNVCGQPILTTPGDFLLPDEQLKGVCCGVCGPRVETFLESHDLADLPDGPLRTLIAQRGRIRSGLLLLDLIQWLWSQGARLDFYEKNGEHLVKASCRKSGGTPFERHEYESASVSQAIQGLGKVVEVEAAKQLPN